MSEQQTTKIAAFCFLERDGKYFYLRRANTGWRDGYLTVPSGHVDEGETVKAGAVREAAEEAGVTVKESDLRFMQAQCLRDRYCYFYFVTDTWEGEPGVHEPDLASEALWIDKQVIPEDCIPYIKALLENYPEKELFLDVEPDRGD